MMDRFPQPTPSDPEKPAFEQARRDKRQPYTRPAIIHELNLEVRAGSPNFIGLPEINPFDIG